jgi:hypothetical protein
LSDLYLAPFGPAIRNDEGAPGIGAAEHRA